LDARVHGAGASDGAARDAEDRLVRGRSDPVGALRRTSAGGFSGQSLRHRRNAPGGCHAKSTVARHRSAGASARPHPRDRCGARVCTRKAYGQLRGDRAVAPQGGSRGRGETRAPRAGDPRAERRSRPSGHPAPDDVGGCRDFATDCGTSGSASPPAAAAALRCSAAGQDHTGPVGASRPASTSTGRGATGAEDAERVGSSGATSTGER
jgi:hypothetical protein